MVGITEVRPEDCKHYEDVQDVPTELRKYWFQRYNIFSRYDEDIWLTDDSWYGVTPEPVANAIAAHIAQAAPKSSTVLVDAFAGIGGNTIAFARSGRWERIFAVEQDETTLACAKHNARIYGVEKKIFWIKGDCFAVLKKQLKSVGKEAVVFGSPPWGGPGYSTDAIFNLSTMQPYSLRALYDSFSTLSKDVVLYLPRTSDLNEIAQLVTEGTTIDVKHYCMAGASKALCVYYGGFKFN